MSGIWCDFDRSSQHRGKPASPVTSMEQAEALPNVSTTHEDRAHVTNNTCEDVHNLSDPSPADSVGRGWHDSVDHRGTPASSTLNNEIDLIGFSDDKPQTRNDEESIGPTDSDSIIAKSLDSQPLKPENLSLSRETEKASSPSKTAKGGSPTQSGDGDSQWPPSSDSLIDETCPGDLRKNSIAAMKELGGPMATQLEAAAPEEEESLASFDFQNFMDSLRAKSADPIARYIKSFLQEFTRAAWTPKQQEKIVSDFHKFISVKLRDYEPFASMNRHERLNSLEGVEKLIMNRLYGRTFSPKIPPILRTDGHNEDLLSDQILEEKMRLWGWVEGRHLDIKNEYLKSNFIQLATAELGRLNQFKSPRDKMICILNCSKVIYALIRQAKLEQNADSFLPLLIYVVIKAHPIHLVSTINYIQRFRMKEFQRGETAYYLSTLASSVTFIETLDHSSLTITSEEFEQRMTDSARAEQIRLQQKQAEYELAHDSTGDAETHEGESSAAVLTASAGMLVDRIGKMASKFLEDLSSPEEGTPEPASRSTQAQDRRGSFRGYREAERAARDASLEDFKAEQAQRDQIIEASETLQNMFPTLDKDLIDDVIRQNGPNVGSAVDICLSLVG